MKKNMGTLDRVVRFSLTLVIGILYLLGELSGTAAIILGLFAGIFAITSLIGFCPLYFPFKLSTAPRTEPAKSNG